MKIFVKVLCKQEKAMTYFRNMFSRLNEAQIKEGVFIGPQIKAMLQDKESATKLNNLEKRGWDLVKSVCSNILEITAQKTAEKS